MQYMSPSTQGLYNTRTYPKAQLPSDVVEITEEQFWYLLKGQNAGKVMAVDTAGQPTLIDPVTGPDELARQERFRRDSELERVKWLRERHRDELELSMSPSLTSDQYSQLLTYMQQLREWPQSPDFPDPAHRPVAPGWIESETQ